MNQIRKFLGEALAWVQNEAFQLEYQLTEIYENAQPWAQESSANKDRLAAASTLGMLKTLQLPASIQGSEHLVEWSHKNERSRPDRRDNLVRCLRACANCLYRIGSSDALLLRKQILENIDILNEVHFPPMFSRRSYRASA